MTDDLTPDELLEDAAREVAHVEPEPIADAADLPADVKDGRIEDEGESHPSIDHEPPTEDKEP